MDSLCQKCSRLGSDSTKAAYAKCKPFPQFCDRYIIAFKTALSLQLNIPLLLESYAIYNVELKFKFKDQLKKIKSMKCFDETGDWSAA